MRYHCMMPKHPICWSLTTSGSIHLWPASCRMPIFVNNLLVYVFYPTLLFLEIFNAHMECFVLSRWWSCRTNRRCAGPKVHDPTDALQHCWVEGAKSQGDWAVGAVVDCRRNEGNLSHSKRVIFQITMNLSDYDRTWKSLFDGVLASHEGFLNGARQGHEKEVTPSSLSSSLWGWHLWIERFLWLGVHQSRHGPDALSRVES